MIGHHDEVADLDPVFADGASEYAAQDGVEFLGGFENQSTLHRSRGGFVEASGLEPAKWVTHALEYAIERAGLSLVGGPAFRGRFLTKRVRSSRVFQGRGSRVTAS